MTQNIHTLRSAVTAYVAGVEDPLRKPDVSGLFRLANRDPGTLSRQMNTAYETALWERRTPLGLEDAWRRYLLGLFELAGVLSKSATRYQNQVTVHHRERSYGYQRVSVFTLEEGETAYKETGYSREEMTPSEIEELKSRFRILVEHPWIEQLKPCFAGYHLVKTLSMINDMKKTELALISSSLETAKFIKKKDENQAAEA